ncbi:MAG: ferrous iron transport protein A [Clostridiales bacterium]|nr:ferrous iron transport protein A [Clostridiales bacterium]
MRLSDLKINESGVVLKISSIGSLRRRLLDMGITNNTEIKIIKRAPLGDPIEIFLRGYELIVREEDAKLIEVKKI